MPRKIINKLLENFIWILTGIILMAFMVTATTTITDTIITTTGDISMDGTLSGTSPIKIEGINITNNTFSHMENINGSLRFTLQNLNDSTNATTVISARNDVGHSMSIGIGSSNFQIDTSLYPNVTALFSRSRGSMLFANFFNEIFIWFHNPQDDNDPANLAELMRLDENGLNVSNIIIRGFNTGDVLSNEIDLTIGEDRGAIEIGDIQLFQSNLEVGALDLNGTFITRHTGGDSPIRFAWTGANNLIRFAIPREGTSYAVYNPRSSMIGGDLGQDFNNSIINCTAQGYDFIDCSTDLTGADLGIQDDIEFWGSLYGGNGTWNVTDNGNLYTIGNITAENSFVSQYIFAHDNATITLASANVWANITFDQEVADIKKGITHTFDDSTNHTFTINEDGIYDIDYNFDVIDTSVSASDIDVAGRIIFSNGTEIEGSVFETDIIKQNIENEISHSLLARLRNGDVIVFQFIADDVDVEVSTHGTFGVHPESVTIRIEKIANL